MLITSCSSFFSEAGLPLIPWFYWNSKRAKHSKASQISYPQSLALLYPRELPLALHSAPAPKRPSLPAVVSDTIQKLYVNFVTFYIGPVTINLILIVHFW